MIKHFNKVILVGTNVADPEYKTFESGSEQIKIRIAVDKSYKNNSGEWVNQSDFIPVEMWGKVCGYVNEHLKKGDVVRVQGKITSNEYEKDGQKRTYWYVKPDFGYEGLQILEKKKDRVQPAKTEVVNDDYMGMQFNSAPGVPF